VTLALVSAGGLSEKVIFPSGPTIRYTCCAFDAALAAASKALKANV
jgi:hypothetical protein